MALTNEELEKLLAAIEIDDSLEEAQEPAKQDPEETQDWKSKYEDASKQLEESKAQVAVLETQNKRMFETLGKMVNRVPVSTEAPKPPETDEQRYKNLAETYDFKKLDFT